MVVRAAFAPLPDEAEDSCDGGLNCPSRAFQDLDTSAWYHEAVDFILRSGLMRGYGNGLFEPDAHLTRAQFVQILYNKEGKPATSGESVFTDVAAGAWYADAVIWAAEHGIVDGYDDGSFGPGDTITREQLAAMLWRYAGCPAAGGEALRFADADEVSGYALEALCWAVENGIVNGNVTLDPSGPATRAQAAQMLKNFLEK